MNRCSRGIILTLMIIFALLSVVQASSAAESAQGPEVEWIKEYPSSEAEILSVCESPYGGYYAAGAGPEGRLVMRLDGEGNILWKKNIPGSDANGSIKLIQESPAGGLILFADGEDLLKITDKAEFEWEFHQPMGKVYSVEVAPDGSTVMAGTFIQGFLTEVSPAGTESWNRTFSDPEGGGQYVIRSVQNDPEAGFIIAGYIDPIFMITDYRGFLMKTDDEGRKVWARQYSEDSSGMIVSVVCRPSGGYAVTRLQLPVGPDNSTLFMPSVMFTNPEGKVTGSEYYNEFVSYLFHITNAGDGGYYLSGLILGESPEPDEYKILRTDLSGKLLWEKSLGDLEMTAFITTSDGGFLIAGRDPVSDSSVLEKYAKDNTSAQASGFGLISVFAALTGAGLFAMIRKDQNKQK